ncbi:MAG: amidohydrolase [Clostridiaceae bacterium]|nr:amidohydrolase [Clostridiaceae bacterium]
MTDAGKVKRGLPLDDILVIDCHAHLGPWAAFHGPKETAEDMLVNMDALGIDAACISAHAAIGPDYAYGNNFMMETVKKYPGRFIGYAAINPNYPGEIRAEIDRCLKIPQVKGIKVHPGFHKYPMDHKYYHIVYEEADKRRCPVLMHTWGMDSILAVGRIAGMYPRANFIMGHAGGSDIKAMEKAVELACMHDNLYLDLVLSMAYEGNVEWLVREAGSKKVLFGTDMPFYDGSFNLGRIALAEISDDEKKDIFGLNAKRLLGI